MCSCVLSCGLSAELETVAFVENETVAQPEKKVLRPGLCPCGPNLRSDRCPSPQIRSLCKVTVQVDPNQAKVTVQVDLTKGQATILGHSPSEPNLRSRLSVVSVGSDERFVVKFMLISSSNYFLHQNRGNKPAMYICGLTAGWTDKMGQFTGLFIEWLIYGFALFYFGN